MRRQDSQRLVVRRIAVAVAVLFAAGCGGKHYLAQYQFSNRTLALVYVEPPSPQLLHGYGDLGVAQTDSPDPVNQEPSCHCEEH